MFRRSLVLAGLLALTSCRTSLEETPDADGSGARVCKVSTVAACTAAETHSDLAWIEMNVFKPACAFSGCHNGSATVAGRIDMMNLGNAHADLVGVDSMIEPGRKLVVAGMPKQSYLLMMMQQFKPAEMEPTPVPTPPTDIGFMPQGTDNVPVCCQKIDAVERWITAGAMP
jgi:hypothetical protein